MDKFEYKVRAEEIKTLIAQREYAQAAEIADSIDWRRVKSVMMLCTISDLYKINRRFEDARDLLLLAYDRHPGGRTIVYSLCELSIKMEDFVQAVEYYKEFVQTAQKDSGRYILQYRLYEAQDVSLEERIGVLEELKKRDYREKWAYELAYLYHRIGLGSRCVEECDELILWFGTGKYVIKAMELKMLHQPLSQEQQAKYDARFQEEEYNSYSHEEMPTEQDQAEAPYMEGTPDMAEMSDEAGEYPGEMWDGTETSSEAADSHIYQAPTIRIPSDEIDIQVKTMDVGQYNTINLQKELAEGLKEVLGQGPVPESEMDSDTESLDLPYLEEVDEYYGEPETVQETEVFFGETGEISSEQILIDNPVTEKVASQTAEIHEIPRRNTVSEDTAELVMRQLRQEKMGIVPKEEEAVSQTHENVEPPKNLADVLSMESDGQIKLVVPDEEYVEKQITGQLSIEDVLSEWERMKKDSEEKRKEAVRQRVLQHTGAMFTEFDASVRDGLLEQLENDKITDEEIDYEAEFYEENAPEELMPHEVLEEIAEMEEESLEASEEELEEEVSGEEVSEEEPFEEVPGEEVPFEEVFEEGNLEEVSAEVPGEEVPFAEVSEEGNSEEASGEEVSFAEVSEAGNLEEVSGEEVSSEEVPFEEVPGKEKSSEKVPGKEVSSEEIPVEEDSISKEASVNASAGGSGAIRQPGEEPAEKAHVRSLTREEKELYAPYIQSKAAREQLTEAIDNISLAAYTGNVIITGSEGTNTLSLAKKMIREIQINDSNFSGKVAKITGEALNKKAIAPIISQLGNGALIIQKASGMNDATANALQKELQKESHGIIVFMEDTKKAISKMLTSFPKLNEYFNSRMDIEDLSNDTLVAFGVKYAREQEYAVDELGILALHTQIADRQTSEHSVTVMEVKDMVDNAISRADRKTIGHFIDVLLAKRYDDEDMIILREKDFNKS